MPDGRKRGTGLRVQALSPDYPGAPSFTCTWLGDLLGKSPGFCVPEPPPLQTRESGTVPASWDPARGHHFTGGPRPRP